MPDLLDEELLAEDLTDPASPKATEQPPPPRSEADAWLSKHRGKSFVPVNGPITSKPKFQGERLGWVFKVGEEGLGYYAEGGTVRTVHLFPEVVSWASTRPTLIN